jgi:hypothetical protein
MKNFFLKTAATFLLLITYSFAGAQNQMVVELSNGNTERFLVPEIRSIKFGASTMIINRFNSAPVTFNIIDIAQYSFSDVTSIKSNMNENGRALGIFPNPASEHIDIVYNNQSKEQIRIELLDATGRSINVVFNGTHQGKQAYKQALGVTSGLYFCRIISEGKTITKPFIVKL